jgi:hypothetical protein
LMTDEEGKNGENDCIEKGKMRKYFAKIE